MLIGLISLMLVFIYSLIVTMLHIKAAIEHFNLDYQARFPVKGFFPTNFFSQKHQRIHGVGYTPTGRMFWCWPLLSLASILALTFWIHASQHLCK